MVNVDTVYQRVLTLANKEQRGYITPQEFNLLANHAQMEIFEQYFHDIKLLGKTPGNDAEYSDPLNALYEKISIFEKQQTIDWAIANMTVINRDIYNGGDFFAFHNKLMYKLGTVSVAPNTVRGPFYQAELLNNKDFNAAMSSPLTSPTLERPIASLFNSKDFTSMAGSIWNLGLRIGIGQYKFGNHDDVLLRIDMTIKPGGVRWGYVIVNDKPLYNSNTSIDFMLHVSEETELVYKILKLAGVNLKNEAMMTQGQALEQFKLQQEKQ